MRVKKKCFKGNICWSGNQDSVVPRAPGVTSSLQQLLVTRWVAGRKRSDRDIHRRTRCPTGNTEVQFLDGWTTDLCASRRGFPHSKIVRLQLGLFAFLGSLLYLEAFSSLPPSWLLNSICSMAPVFRILMAWFTPRALFGIKMYSENIGKSCCIDNTYFHQNAESGEIIRGSFFFFLPQASLYFWNFLDCGFHLGDLRDLGSGFSEWFSLTQLGSGYTILGALKTRSGASKPQESPCNMEHQLHSMQK